MYCSTALRHTHAHTTSHQSTTTHMHSSSPLELNKSPNPHPWTLHYRGWRHRHAAAGAVYRPAAGTLQNATFLNDSTIKDQCKCPVKTRTNLLYEKFAACALHPAIYKTGRGAGHVAAVYGPAFPGGPGAARAAGKRGLAHGGAAGGRIACRGRRRQHGRHTRARRCVGFRAWGLRVSWRCGALLLLSPAQNEWACAAQRALCRAPTLAPRHQPHICIRRCSGAGIHCRDGVCGDVGVADGAPQVMPPDSPYRTATVGWR